MSVPEPCRQPRGMAPASHPVWWWSSQQIQLGGGSRKAFPGCKPGTEEQPWLQQDRMHQEQQCLQPWCQMRPWCWWLCSTHLLAAPFRVGDTVGWGHGVHPLWVHPVPCATAELCAGAGTHAIPMAMLGATHSPQALQQQRAWIHPYALLPGASLQPAARTHSHAAAPCLLPAVGTCSNAAASLSSRRHRSVLARPRHPEPFWGTQEPAGTSRGCPHAGRGVG